MAALQTNPFGMGSRQFAWLVLAAYLAGTLPAIITALTHTALRNRGLHSVFSIFVAAILTPVFVNFFIGTLRGWEFVVVGMAAGLLVHFAGWSKMEDDMKRIFNVARPGHGVPPESCERTGWNRTSLTLVS